MIECVYCRSHSSTGPQHPTFTLLLHHHPPPPTPHPHPPHHNHINIFYFSPGALLAPTPLPASPSDWLDSVWAVIYRSKPAGCIVHLCRGKKGRARGCHEGREASMHQEGQKPLGQTHSRQDVRDPSILFFFFFFFFAVGNAGNIWHSRRMWSRFAMPLSTCGCTTTHTYIAFSLYGKNWANVSKCCLFTWVFCLWKSGRKQWKIPTLKWSVQILC